MKIKLPQWDRVDWITFIVILNLLGMVVYTVIVDIQAFLAIL